MSGKPAASLVDRRDYRGSSRQRASIARMRQLVALKRRTTLPQIGLFSAQAPSSSGVCFGVYSLFLSIDFSESARQSIGESPIRRPPVEGSSRDSGERLPRKSCSRRKSSDPRPAPESVPPLPQGHHQSPGTSSVPPIGHCPAEPARTAPVRPHSAVDFCRFAARSRPVGGTLPDRAATCPRRPGSRRRRCGRRL